MNDVLEWTHDPRDTLSVADMSAGSGPWWDEPDKRHWVDPATDMDCLMVRNHYGVWCGYVAVTEEHPWFEKPYQDVDENVNVHGGLTFSEFCHESEQGEGYGICHLPLKGRPDRVWWFGFDCGHFMDYQPVLAVSMPGMFEARGVQYRDVAYVQAECEALAAQLAAVR